MKFGKLLGLACEANPQLGSLVLRYKQLKKVLKQLQQVGSSNASCSTETADDGSLEVSAEPQAGIFRELGFGRDSVTQPFARDSFVAPPPSESGFAWASVTQQPLSRDSVLQSRDGSGCARELSSQRLAQDSVPQGAQGVAQGSVAQRLAQDSVPQGAQGFAQGSVPRGGDGLAEYWPGTRPFQLHSGGQPGQAGVRQMEAPSWPPCSQLLSREQQVFLQMLNQDLARFNDFYMDKEEDGVMRMQCLADTVSRLQDLTVHQTQVLRASLVDLHGELVLCLHWSLLNCSGVLKILKKHDKLQTGLVLRTAMQRIIRRQPFSSTTIMQQLVRRAEQLVAVVAAHQAQRQEAALRMTAAQELEYSEPQQEATTHPAAHNQGTDPGQAAAVVASYEAAQEAAVLLAKDGHVFRRTQQALQMWATLGNTASTPSTVLPHILCDLQQSLDATCSTALEILQGPEPGNHQGAGPVGKSLAGRGPEPAASAVNHARRVSTTGQQEESLIGQSPVPGVGRGTEATPSGVNCAGQTSTTDQQGGGEALARGATSSVSCAGQTSTSSQPSAVGSRGQASASATGGPHSATAQIAVGPTSGLQPATTQPAVVSPNSGLQSGLQSVIGQPSAVNAVDGQTCVTEAPALTVPAIQLEKELCSCSPGMGVKDVGVRARVGALAPPPPWDGQLAEGDAKKGEERTRAGHVLAAPSSPALGKRKMGASGKDLSPRPHKVLGGDQ